jgi:DNA-binding CsgD family transcriptional regulator
MRKPVTKREGEILRLLSKDLTAQELADQLCISLQTVKSHRKNLLRKMGVRTTAGLVRKGFESGILKVFV